MVRLDAISGPAGDRQDADEGVGGHPLRPCERVERGLAGGVRSHAESVRGTAGLDVEVDVDLSPDVGDLPVELQEDLYRVVQEALHNVVKHAGATRAAVHISTS